MSNRLLHRATILVLAFFIGSCSNNEENTAEDKNAIEDENATEDEKPIEAEETVKLSGEVIYDAYQGGVIFVRPCESVSTSYSPKGSIQAQHPGDCKEKTALQQPGKFSLETTMSWVDEGKPDIDLAVYLVENKDDGMGDCLAGALIRLPLENHQDLTVNMEKGRCPIRK